MPRVTCCAVCLFARRRASASSETSSRPIEHIWLARFTSVPALVTRTLASKPAASVASVLAINGERQTFAAHTTSTLLGTLLLMVSALGGGEGGVGHLGR